MPPFSCTGPHDRWLAWLRVQLLLLQTFALA
jgi:hypothetical protein